MQRFCAILLVALFGFPLILPGMIPLSNNASNRVQNDANLPACCRRGGKHHCGDAAPADRRETSGATIYEKCPHYPEVRAIPGFSNLILLNASQAFFSSIVKHPALSFQAEAPQRILFSRSRQKRGPPVLFS